MELIKSEYEQCKECGKIIKELIVFDVSYNNSYQICVDCLCKAILLVKPIDFDKDVIASWLKQKLEEDGEACAQEGMSNENWGGHCQKFIEWVQPFLESK